MKNKSLLQQKQNATTLLYSSSATRSSQWEEGKKSKLKKTPENVESSSQSYKREDHPPLQSASSLFLRRPPKHQEGGGVRTRPQRGSGFLLLLLLLHEPLAGPQVQFELLHDPRVPLRPLNELLQGDLTWNNVGSSKMCQRQTSHETRVCATATQHHQVQTSHSIFLTSLELWGEVLNFNTIAAPRNTLRVFLISTLNYLSLGAIHPLLLDDLLEPLPAVSG